MMKKIAFAALLALTVTPATAQMYPSNVPVCMQVYLVGGGFTECRYASIAQCQQSASGRSATCMVNPFFEPREAPPLRRRR